MRDIKNAKFYIDTGVKVAPNDELLDVDLYSWLMGHDVVWHLKLRPLSDMSEEEKDYLKGWGFFYHNPTNRLCYNDSWGEKPPVEWELIEWATKRKFDLGLIPDENVKITKRLNEIGL